MEACLENKQPSSEETESVAVHEDVCKEEATVETFGTLKEQYGDQQLVVGCHQELQKQTQSNGGSQKKLATACRGMTTVQEWHSIRDTVIQERWSNRDNGKIGPGTMLQQKPPKDGCSGGDIGRNWNTTMA
jgi:hypothetical protein